MLLGFWLSAGWIALRVFRVCEVDPGRAAGLVLGACLAHLGWVAVHAGAIVDDAGVMGLVRWLGLPTAGASVLFLPLGPILVRGATVGADLARRAVRHSTPHLATRIALDADLRALIPALAVAKAGCHVLGCCAGIQASAGSEQWRLALSQWVDWPGLPGSPHPVAAYEMIALGALAWATRAPGRGAIALAGFGAIRWASQSLRAAPPHGGSTEWVGWLCAGWIFIGMAGIVAMAGIASARRPGHASDPLQKSSPSSKPQTAPAACPRPPKAPMPSVASSRSIRRWVGVPSFSFRPRGAAVRHMRKTPRR